MVWTGKPREPLASLFYNRRHHIAKQQHAVERTRELFAKAWATNHKFRAITPLPAIFPAAASRRHMPSFYMPQRVMINTGLRATGVSCLACWLTAACD
jgi:ADP-heptose:LPS heptosyltransferase